MNGDERYIVLLSIIMKRLKAWKEIKIEHPEFPGVAARIDELENIINELYEYVGRQ